MPRKQQTFEQKRPRGEFEYGGYWIDKISISPNYYYFRYNRDTGKNVHRTLGTRDLDEAKEKLIDLVKAKGEDQAGLDQDPHMMVVIECYLKNAKLLPKAWGGAPTMLVEAIRAADVTVKVSGFDPVFQCEIFEYLNRLNRSPNSMTSIMRLASAAVRWVTKYGRRYGLRISTRQMFVTNVVEICKLLQVPVPEPRNEHPDMAGMAKMLRAAGDDELLRRWFLLTLFWASRPGCALQADRSRMIKGTRLFNLLPKGMAPSKKRRPVLPFSDVVLAEIAGWPEDHWVDWQLPTINRKTKELREALGVDDFMPSCIRDFMASAMRRRHPKYGVPKANTVELMVWMGHAVMTDTHRRYGHFDEDYLASAMASAEAVLLELDELSGGVLFRQESAKALAAARREELIAAYRTEPQRRGLTRDLAGLAGKTVENVGLIEGVQGRFRQVSPKPVTPFLHLSELTWSGSKYLLPHLDAWFELARIAVLDTELLIEYEVVPSRIFVDMESQKVMTVEAVRDRMIADLGTDPGGWDKHTAVQAAESILQMKGPFEYQDPTQPHYPPRGLQHVVGRPLGREGMVEGLQSGFSEAPMPSAAPLGDGERYNWRYYLRNLSAWFEHNQIQAFEANLLVGGQVVPARIFANLLTEELLDPHEVRELMCGELGCDPGGWELHSSLAEKSYFDAERFIATTPLRDVLDCSADQIDPDGWVELKGWAGAA